jgi:hypothetical protein
MGCMSGIKQPYGVRGFHPAGLKASENSAEQNSQYSCDEGENISIFCESTL